MIDENIAARLVAKHGDATEAIRRVNHRYAIAVATKHDARTVLWGAVATAINRAHVERVAWDWQSPPAAGRPARWRRSPAALRALARWTRLAVLTLAALLAFILAAYLTGEP